MENSRSQTEVGLSTLVEGTDAPVWTVDVEFRLISCNRALQEYVGKHYGRHFVAGMTLDNCWPPEEAAIWLALYRRALAEGYFRAEFSLPDDRTIEAFLCPILADQHPTGISIFARDMTDRKRSEQALASSEKLFRAIAQTAPIAIVLWSGYDQSNAYFNPAFSQLFGYSPEEMPSVAAWWSLAYPDPEYRASLFHEWQSRVKRAIAVRSSIEPMESEITCKDGTKKHASWGFTSIGEQNISFGIDLTEHRKAEESLRESADFLAQAQRIGGLGCYLIDISRGVMTCSAILNELFGRNKSAPLTVKNWLSLIHPEDRDRVAARFQDEVQGDAPLSVLEYRILRPSDHEERWMHTLGKVEFDDQGHRQRVRGVIQDITERKRAELLMQESEERFRSTFEQAAVGIAHISWEGRYLRWNRRYAEIAGYSLEEIGSLGFQQITAPEYLAESVRLLEEIQQGKIDSVTFEKQLIRKDGTPAWVRVTVSPQRDRTGHAQHMISVVEDINTLKSAEQARRLSEARYRTAFETSLDGICLSHLEDGRLIDANRAFLNIHGFKKEEILGRTALELNLWASPLERKKAVELLRRDSSFKNHEFQLRRKNGEIFWATASGSVLELDGVPSVLFVVHDISASKAAEEKIQTLSYYDPLTNLPNRRLLMERLDSSLAASRQSHRNKALLILDLDQFKNLNDTLGHRVGDLLLQEVARRLGHCVRESDVVARVGGNEFAVVLENLSKTAAEAAAQAQQMGERILQEIGRTYTLDALDAHCAAVIGIAIFGEQETDAEEILQQADIAMEQARGAGRNTMRYFSAELQEAVNARVRMEEDLRQLGVADQLVLYYQPQVKNNRLIGAEALVRWQHPTKGLLSPGAFIPLAEETGQILPIGSWILKAACQQIAAWAGHEQLSQITVAVNISARQLHEADFVKYVLSVLESTGANPQRLKLELTESMLVKNVELVIPKMEELKSYGLRFSLDDFGTGYSSLSYLKHLPLDELKIDLSFVRDILVDASSHAIAQTIVTLSRAMGLSVIAEGVETSEQQKLLAELDCHSCQGYLIGRPVPAKEFERTAAKMGDVCHQPVQSVCVPLNTVR
jgi:diguanylate cyclase (GGDEF)-like protein/PAS domain S-box-containing protein